MIRILLAQFLLIATSSALAEAIHIPEKTYLSKDDLYLKGHISQMTFTTYPKEYPVPIMRDEYKISFYRNGLVKEINSRMGMTGKTFEYDQNFKKLLKQETFLNTAKSEKVNHFVGIVKDYDGDRPQTIIYNPYLYSNDISGKTFIHYSPNQETYIFYNNNSEKLGTLKNYFDPESRNLIKSINRSVSPFMKNLELEITTTYAKSGIYSIKTDKYQTEYIYQDDELIEIKESDPSGLNIKFLDYKYDSCNNWISRSLNLNNQITLEERKFDYYQKC